MEGYSLIETELKCKLSPELFSKLQKKLQQLRFDGTVHNIDTYYDTSDFALLKQAVFVRVRNNKQLDFKFNEKIVKVHGQSTERTFSLPLSVDKAEKMNALFTRFLPCWQSSPTVETAFKENGLIELARIDNRRDAHSGNKVYVSIDHVAGLGDFLEVETHNEEGADTTKAVARLQNFVADLDVQHINVGYVELWLLEHNPLAYELGQYHLS